MGARRNLPEIIPHHEPEVAVNYDFLAPPVALTGVFYADKGAVYDLTPARRRPDIGTTEAFAVGTGMVYTSNRHLLHPTGKVRRQRTGQGARVTGRRALFYLDNGEGLVPMRGVWCH